MWPLGPVKWAPYLVGALLILGAVGLVYQKGRLDVRQAEKLKDAGNAATTAQTQADVNAADGAQRAASADRQIVIIRETASAVEAIRQAPIRSTLGSGGVVGADDLRGLRDSVQRLRDKAARERDRFLATGETTEPLPAPRPPKR